LRIFRILFSNLPETHLAKDSKLKAEIGKVIEDAVECVALEYACIIILCNQAASDLAQTD
jgi:hypothetical protein